jgi:Protein of unknown function (DUF1153)
MTNDAEKRAKLIIGPDGSVLTLASLPAPNPRRWVARRKAEIVAAVQGGLLDMTDACSRYQISHEEFITWDRAYRSRGLRGLRAANVLRAV